MVRHKHIATIPRVDDSKHFMLQKRFETRLLIESLLWNKIKYVRKRFRFYRINLLGNMLLSTVLFFILLIIGRYFKTTVNLFFATCIQMLQRTTKRNLKQTKALIFNLWLIPPCENGVTFYILKPIADIGTKCKSRICLWGCSTLSIAPEFGCVLLWNVFIITLEWDNKPHFSR